MPHRLNGSTTRCSFNLTCGARASCNLPFYPPWPWIRCQVTRHTKHPFELLDVLLLRARHPRDDKTHRASLHGCAPRIY